jgi:type I restriction enzyme, R subunit
MTRSSGGAAGTAAMGPSPNFAYLAHHDPRLAEVATRAERVLALDPEGALNHLRLFGELLAKNAAARLGAYEAGEEHQVDRLRALRRHNLAENVLQMLHGLRQAGNLASHEFVGSQQAAFTQLKVAFQLARRTGTEYQEPRLGTHIPWDPQDPNDEPASVLLERIRAGKENGAPSPSGRAPPGRPRRRRG